MHQLMANTLDKAFAEIGQFKQTPARMDSSSGQSGNDVLRSPKGWTVPTGDGKQTKAHGARPGAALGFGTNPAIQAARKMMKSYKPEELFDEKGHLKAELMELASDGDRRMAQPHANGVFSARILKCRTFVITRLRFPVRRCYRLRPHG